jgi:hypothetical protein
MARIYPFITFQNTQTVVIGVAAQVVLWDLQCIVTVAWLQISNQWTIMLFLYYLFVQCFTFIFSASQNGRFSYGYASSPGKRASMEDFYETKIDCVDGQIVGLFGVFDGMDFS